MLLHEREREYAVHQTRSAAELEEAQKRLAELNDYNRSILQSVNTAMIIADLTGRVTTCNRYAAEILEVQPASVLGRPLKDAVRLADFADLIERSMVNRIARERGEVSVRRHSGQAMSLGVGVSLLKDHEGSVKGAIACFRDLTPVKAMQDALTRSEKLAALGRLSAEVAHEVRNPLNAIRGFGQLIQEGTREEDSLHGYAATIMDEVDRLSKFLSGVLDFARVKTPSRVRLDLWQLIDETLELTRSRIANAGVTVTTERGEAAQCSGDPEKLKQVFLNIIVNAIDAMPDGGDLTVGVRADADPAFVLIYFKDTGCGLSKSQMQHVFDPFVTAKPQGTGLGLAVSHQIVEAHGGRIEVQSAPGEGATFTVRLPRGEPQTGQTEQDTPAPAASVDAGVQ